MRVGILAKGVACGGKYKLVYEPWDDASAALGKWDPAVERGWRVRVGILAKGVACGGAYC